MSSSMRRADGVTAGHGFRALLVGLGLALSVPAHAATPVPLAPCQVGGIRLAREMTLASLTASVRRAFPRAVLSPGQTSGGGVFRDARVSDAGEPLMTIVYYARSPARLIAHVDLTSPRFQLAPGVRPGTPLNDAAALGPVTLEYNPTDGVEDVTAPRAQAALDGWERAGCTAQLRAGPAPKAGMYAGGASQTRRLRPGARIAKIEIDL